MWLWEKDTQKKGREVRDLLEDVGGIIFTLMIVAIFVVGVIVMWPFLINDHVNAS